MKFRTESFSSATILSFFNDAIIRFTLTSNAIEEFISQDIKYDYFVTCVPYYLTFIIPRVGRFFASLLPALNNYPFSLTLLKIHPSSACSFNTFSTYLLLGDAGISSDSGRRGDLFLELSMSYGLNVMFLLSFILISLFFYISKSIQDDLEKNNSDAISTIAIFFNSMFVIYSFSSPSDSFVFAFAYLFFILRFS